MPLATKTKFPPLLSQLVDVITPNALGQFAALSVLKLI